MMIEAYFLYCIRTSPESPALMRFIDQHPEHRDDMAGHAGCAELLHLVLMDITAYGLYTELEVHRS